MTDEQAKIIGKEIGSSVAYEMRRFFDELTRLVFYPRGTSSSMLENFAHNVSESIKTGFKILADQARK